MAVFVGNDVVSHVAALLAPQTLPSFHPLSEGPMPARRSSLPRERINSMAHNGLWAMSELSPLCDQERTYSYPLVGDLRDRESFGELGNHGTLRSPWELCQGCASFFLWLGSLKRHTGAASRNRISLLSRYSC